MSRICMKYLTLDVKQSIHPKHIVFFLHSLGVSIQLVGGLLPVGRCSCHMTFCNEVIHLYKILGILINQILLASTKTSTQTWACACNAIFLMMRLKSFSPEVDKSWQSRRECQKLKKKSPINDFFKT